MQEIQAFSDPQGAPVAPVMSVIPPQFAEGMMLGALLAAVFVAITALTAMGCP